MLAKRTSRCLWIAVVCLGLGHLASAQKTADDRRSSIRSDRIFAPYLFLASPAPNLPAIAREARVKFLTLAFVVAKGTACEPQWRGGPTVSEDTSVAQQISDFRRTGGQVILSFGGVAGAELAETCPDAATLQVQYQAVMDKYKVRMLDFDLESTKSGRSVIERRTQALLGLRKNNPNLSIGYTLPADPGGITPAGMELLKAGIARGLKIDLVNLLAMDYGGSADPKTMGKNAIDAAQSALKQLDGIGMSAELGITPMIGVNDVQPEVFTLTDARTVFDFAQDDPRITRLSFWSLGRDRECEAPSAQALPSCSGISQKAFAFTDIFRQFH